MNVKFTKVKMSNFMSFEDAEMTLDSNGYVAVFGVNTNPNDMATSNGSGKSSLFEAILWAMTGDTSRGTKDVSNRYTNDGALVELEFDVDNDSYKLIRAKGNKQYKTNLLIYKNGKDISGKGIRDTEKILESVLPDLNASLIGSVIILGQGMPQRFTSNTPSGRKEVLENLSKSDFMIEDLKNRISDRKAKLTTDLNNANSDIMSMQKSNDVFASKISSYRENLTALGDVEDLRVRSLSIENDINTKNDIIEEINSSLTKDEGVLSQYRLDYTKVKDSMTESLNDVTRHEDDDIKKNEPDLIEKKTRKGVLESEIRRIDSIRDVCPTCGQKIPNVNKPSSVSLKEELCFVKSTIEEIEEQNRVKHELAEKQREEIRIVYEKQLNDIQSVAVALKGKMEDNRAKVQSLAKDVKSLESCKSTIDAQIQKYDITVASINQSIKELSVEIDSTSQKILYKQEEALSIKSHLDIISKFNTIISRDFRGYLLHNVIEYIDRKAKVYAQEVFGTNHIRFYLDGNSVAICYDDKPYENLSGGEKQKVDIVIQFSIRDMLCKYLNFSSNILVVDEIFDNLDSIGCQNVINLISKLNDISSVYIITHHSDELSMPYDKELKVVKDRNGISKLI